MISNVSLFNDVGKDALYNAMCECGADYASKNGKDCMAEDVILVMDFMEEAGRIYMRNHI